MPIFPNFSLTGEVLLFFPGFPDPVGKLHPGNMRVIGRRAHACRPPPGGCPKGRVAIERMFPVPSEEAVTATHEISHLKFVQVWEPGVYIIAAVSLWRLRVFTPDVDVLTRPLLGVNQLLVLRVVRVDIPLEPLTSACRDRDKWETLIGMER